MQDPSLDILDARYTQLLSDPLIKLAMKADGVEELALRTLLYKAANGLKLRLTAPQQNLQLPTLAHGDSEKYRSGVGILLLNCAGQAFVGRRIDTATEAWQLPQGGIENGESPREAALRELREEIGNDNVEFLHELPGWFTYDLPPDLAREVWGGRWQGQQQKWFVMRFRGNHGDINVSTEHPEFSGWKWVAPDQLPDLVVPFKRQLYLDVLRELGKLPPIMPR
jgi:putative (di)nucleoside polyphosphate hydrolase